MQTDHNDGRIFGARRHRALLDVVHKVRDIGERLLGRQEAQILGGRIATIRRRQSWFILHTSIV